METWKRWIISLTAGKKKLNIVFHIHISNAFRTYSQGLNCIRSQKHPLSFLGGNNGGMEEIEYIKIRYKTAIWCDGSFSPIICMLSFKEATWTFLTPVGIKTFGNMHNCICIMKIIINFQLSDSFGINLSPSCLHCVMGDRLGAGIILQLSLSQLP